MRSAIRLGLLLAVTLTLTACAGRAGSPQADDPVSGAPAATADSSGAAAPAPGQSDQVATSTPYQLYDYSMSLSAQDGTTLEATIKFGAPVKLDDPAVAQYFPTGVPCTSSDEQRDAVILGTIAFTNTTPGGFDAPVKLTWNTLGGWGSLATPQFGVGYRNGPQCADLNGRGDTIPVVSPSMSGTSAWGPVSVEFTLPNYYSPNTPGGDQTLLELLQPRVRASNGSQGDAYRATSTSPDMEQFYDGLEYLLHVEHHPG